ncbi:MAG: protein translocase subunit SecF [Ruminococcaceae bacterium]|nr:protein translocase subunit SecF [Oscillospiraceae bacterium]
MKRRGKSIFFIVAALIFALTYTAFFGIKQVYGDTETVWFKGASDIRFGIDIKGGVDATFMPADGQDATDEELDAAESVIKLRLVGLNITDYEVYTDYNKDRIIVRFPWKEGEKDFNPEHAINEIGASAVLTFREGYGDGLPVDETADTIVLVGEDVKRASAGAQQDSVTGQVEYVVQLELTTEGATKFAASTTELAQTKEVISIWMDEECISAPTVQTAITDGNAIITGSFDAESAADLANKINAGSLPFDLSAESFSTISPTLGASSLDVMVKAGIIAFLLVAAYIIALYKLPGVIATIALLGQVATTLACVSGFFPDVNSFTLTLPGIAGIILAMGMGVDANVITFERIKEELRDGNGLDEALTNGFKRGLAPIIDGNITVVIVAAVLIGAFGPTDGIFAKIFTPIFFAFGPATAGAIYSFGYTLLIGVIMNFVYGIVATRLMLRSVSKMNMFRNPALYGAKKSYKAKKMFNFIGNSKKFYIGSVALIAVIFIYSAIAGVSMDIQFKGGALLTYGYENEISVSDIENDFKSILGDELTVQQGTNMATGKDTLTVSMPGEQTVTTDELAEIDAMLSEKYTSNNVEQLEVSNVNPTIGKEFFAKSLVGLVAACVLILIYVAIRFRRIGGLAAGSTAIVALIHDLIIIFGVFAICRFTINGNFIAALLTILGYSVNDTVVIYDRVRENKAMHPSMRHDQLVNLSINQSLVRSINTTISTLIALGTVCVVAFVAGLTSIVTFAFPLALGMVSGVYSTICIAGPLWVDYEKRKASKVKAEE